MKGDDCNEKCAEQTRQKLLEKKDYGKNFWGSSFFRGSNRSLNFNNWKKKQKIDLRFFL